MRHDGLDTERRVAFLLTQVLDLSYAEAADVCDCPVGTIRSRGRPEPNDVDEGWSAIRPNGEKATPAVFDTGSGEMTVQADRLRPAPP